MPSARLIGVGAFVVGGLLLFAAGLFMIGNRRMLFSEQFDVHAEFLEVAGLQSGAKVRVSGMDAGEVTTIAVPPAPAGRFRVTMRVREDLHPLVRTDSLATIQNDGIVGNKFVQIEAGSERAAQVRDGGRITSREPFDFSDLLQTANETVKTLSTTVRDLRGHVEEVLNVVESTATDANRLIRDVGDDVERIATAGSRISEDTSEVIAGIRAGRGTVGKLVKDDELYEQAKTIVRETETAVRTAREATEHARSAMAGLQGTVKSGEGSMESMLVDLRRTLSSTREAMGDLQENTEALKRNFLFRGFFRNRGYFDLDELTVAEYRARGVAGDQRCPIRIWIGSDVLFERVQAAAAGPAAAVEPRERLSTDGRLRLDAAMAEVLRYPGNTPLVIEGYADAPTRDEGYRRSRERASQVREYLVSRYQLVSTRVGVIPLGHEAQGSPRGDTWDGIGLAAWVDGRAFEGGGRCAPQAAPTDSSPDGR